MVGMAILFLLILPSSDGRSGGQQCAKAAPSDQEFLSRAAGGNLFEIESSRLAQLMARTRTVRTFADRVVSDRTDAALKFRQAVADANLPPSAETLDDRRQALLDDLNARDVAAFEQAYGERGGNGRMKQFALELLPILKAHLDHVTRLYGASNAA